MKKLAILIIALATLSPSAIGGQGDRAFSFWANGKLYFSRIPHATLAKTPKWTRGDNPPLSAREAIKLGDARRKEFTTNSDKFKWRRKSASVIFENDEVTCYWQIHYETEYQGPGVATGQPHVVDLYVLMDGTFIEPEIQQIKR